MAFQTSVSIFADYSGVANTNLEEDIAGFVNIIYGVI